MTGTSSPSPARRTPSSHYTAASLAFSPSSLASGCARTAELVPWQSQRPTPLYYRHRAAVAAFLCKQPSRGTFLERRTDSGAACSSTPSRSSPLCPTSVERYPRVEALKALSCQTPHPRRSGSRMRRPYRPYPHELRVRDDAIHGIRRRRRRLPCSGQGENPFPEFFVTPGADFAPAASQSRLPRRYPRHVLFLSP